MLTPWVGEAEDRHVLMPWVGVCWSTEARVVHARRSPLVCSARTSLLYFILIYAKIVALEGEIVSRCRNLWILKLLNYRLNAEF